MPLYAFKVYIAPSPYSESPRPVRTRPSIKSAGCASSLRRLRLSSLHHRFPCLRSLLISPRLYFLLYYMPRRQCGRASFGLLYHCESNCQRKTPDKKLFYAILVKLHEPPDFSRLRRCKYTTETRR